MTTWARHLYDFYATLAIPQHPLPGNIQWLYPQQELTVPPVVQTFLNKYFNDGGQRTLIMGINPGRFGAGVTGVNFTAARQLSEVCGIAHPFKMHSELSAEFIYAMITAYGGADAFYRRFFIGSVCPLGFVKAGKNINYYDDKELQLLVEPFIITNMEKLVHFATNRQICFCLGGEKNYKYLAALNSKQRWFKQVVPLPHPRYIMQYRRKQVPEFIAQYLAAFQKK